MSNLIRRFITHENKIKGNNSGFCNCVSDYDQLIGRLYAQFESPEKCDSCGRLSPIATYIMQNIEGGNSQAVSPDSWLD